MHDWALINIYTQYNPRWFESPTRYLPSDEHLALYSEYMPDGWSVERAGLWYFAKPPEVSLPEQGWKLHISVCANDSITCLRRVLPILRDELVSFKFLLDPKTVSLVTSKLWPRGSSGKFITVYPTTQDQFSRLGKRLTQELEHFVGPYILSDRPWPGSSCVYYRYGGFRARSTLQLDGRRTPVIASPDGGLVPDIRHPYWSPPDWVSDPGLPQQRVDGADLVLDEGRFTVTSALRFSNRGGVYRAIDNHTGQDVVIKESRPHINVGRHKVDAIAVLEKEYRLLTLLAATGYFVEPVTYFREGGHAFLVEEFVPGDHLGRFTILRNPLYHGTITGPTLERYFRDVRELWLQLARAIASAHQLGIVLGDLSFTNVIVTEGSRVCILDLECAVEEGVDPQVGLHTQGLAAQRTLESGISDRANDYYALGAIMFGSIMLANGITGFYPPARTCFIEELTADLGLSGALIALIDDLMTLPRGDGFDSSVIERAIARLPIGDRGAPSWAPRLAEPAVRRLDREKRGGLRDRVAETRDAVADFLCGTADIKREDRLFPADLSVFLTNPLSVAFGAAGVLYAVRRMTGDVPGQLMDWLLSRRVHNDEFPPGLFVGQAGIAWVLNELGYPDVAVPIMRSARQHELLWDSPDVFHGAAGYGLACLKLWAAGLGQEFLDDAVRVGQHLDESATRDGRGAHWPDLDGAAPVGYAYGGSGVSLFLLYLHQATGDPVPLALGRQALGFELHQGVWWKGAFAGFPAEVVDTSEAPHVVPRCYWDAGSAGVATTLMRYLVVAPDPTLQGWVAYLGSNLSHKYAVFPQLFHGLAGLGNALLDIWEVSGDERYLGEAWQVAEGILLFRIDRPEGVSFPGEQAIRESADFGTGAAGIGLYLDRLVKADAGILGNFNFVVDELLPATPSEGLRVPLLASGEPATG